MTQSKCFPFNLESLFGETLFFDNEVQSLMKKLTGLNLEKVFFSKSSMDLIRRDNSSAFLCVPHTTKHEFLYKYSSPIFRLTHSV